MVQILGGVGEWIIGNTFSCALFFTYGTFWIVQGTTQMPFFAVGTNYSSTGNTLEGVQTPEFDATIGKFYFSPSCQGNILIGYNRLVLCLFSTSHLRLPDMFTPHKRLPLPCLVPPCYHICFDWSYIFPNGIGERGCCG